MTSKCSYNDPNYEAHFTNVTDLKIVADPQFLPQKLSFDQLNEFELKLSGGAMEKWISFIATNSHLNNLRINDGFVSYAQLLLLTNMANLVDVNLRCNGHIKIDTIVRLIKNGDQLQRGDLKNVNKSTQFELRTALGDQWKVISYISGRSSDVYCFKKKRHALIIMSKHWIGNFKIFTNM